MSRISIVLFLLPFLISCGSRKSQVYYPPDINEAIDLVYETVLRHEFKEVGTRAVIVDQSMGTTSLEVDGFDFVENDSINSYRWKKNIVYAKWLDYRLISSLKLANPNKYFELTNQFKYGGGRVWFELWLPRFTANRKTAIMELFINNGKLKGKEFWVHCAWLVKWDKKKYKIAKYFTNDRSHK